MTVIYITEDNCKCYAVTFKVMGLLKFKNLKMSLLMKILFTQSIQWKHFWVKASVVV